MLPPLTIIPAGAGSGKTYTIQQQLGEWVVEGKIAPERIVAVTFTEAAAAELRERIRAKLLGLGRLEVEGAGSRCRRLGRAARPVFDR